jgi:choline dehydrogenase
MGKQAAKHIVIVGGGTAGAVLAARLSESSALNVTLLEAGADDSTYHDSVLDPVRTYEVWSGTLPHAACTMRSEWGDIEAKQGRILGGTSALNASATLRGQPADYNAWQNAGLEGWGWEDIKNTFITAERDADFPNSPLHGNTGPLPVRRWRRDEFTQQHKAFMDGLKEVGVPVASDINDPAQLPGVGVFPATIDEQSRRVTTSLAYLTPEVRQRENLTIRTHAEVSRLHIENARARGVMLSNGDEIIADEVVLTAGALYSPLLLLRSGVGPAAHLADYGLTVHADLPVGSTMSDHLGPAIYYSHAGTLEGNGGPAQVVLVGASNGIDVDYHGLPLHWAEEDGRTQFQVVTFLLRSSGKGSVRLGESVDAAPHIVAPPMPDDTDTRLSHAFRTLAAWEQTAAAKAIDLQRIAGPEDLTAPGAVNQALEMGIISYFHMTSTCPMGAVLDANCQVLGIEGLRVADASVMPTIPSGNTYLGCVMVAERIAAKMKAAG